MTKRRRMHGRRRRRSVSSPAKFIGGAIGAGIKLVKKLRDRKKGSAEATGRAEGAAQEARPSAKEVLGGKTGDLETTIERVVDRKLGNESEKPKENDAKVLKTPKNDATTKELTTSSKDASIIEGVTRLYKQ
tara:strand:+ start:435 stop:830 length:396 start_codon:yes stop_codon:yes gene_type:complete